MLLRSMKGVGPALWGAAPAPQRPWGHVLGQGAQPSTHSSPGGGGTLAGGDALGGSAGTGFQHWCPQPRVLGLWPLWGARGPVSAQGLLPDRSAQGRTGGAGQQGAGAVAGGPGGGRAPPPRPGSTCRRLKGSEHQAADTQVIHNVLFKSSPSPRLPGAAASSCAGPWALDAAPAGPGAGSAPSLTRNHRAASRRAPARAHITASMCRILRASEIWTLVSI